MTIALSAAVAVLFAAGIFLMLQRSLPRVVAGTVLISHSANLFIMSTSISRGAAPIRPLPGGKISDPLPQALTLTAIVITFAISTIALMLLFRLMQMHESLDSVRLSHAETLDEEAGESKAD